MQVHFYRQKVDTCSWQPSSPQAKGFTTDDPGFFYTGHLAVAMKKTAYIRGRFCTRKVPLEERGRKFLGRGWREGPTAGLFVHLSYQCFGSSPGRRDGSNHCRSLLQLFWGSGALTLLNRRKLCLESFVEIDFSDRPKLSQFQQSFRAFYILFCSRRWAPRGCGWPLQTSPLTGLSSWAVQKCHTGRPRINVQCVCVCVCVCAHTHTHTCKELVHLFTSLKNIVLQYGHIFLAFSLMFCNCSTSFKWGT